MVHSEVTHLDYTLDPEARTRSSKEQHKLKALAAISQAGSLGKLLTLIELNVETRPEDLARSIDYLNDGLQAVGELLALICDAAYDDVEKLYEAHQPSQ